MFLLFAAWRYGNENPYYLHNGPDASPPLLWNRVKTVIFAFAIYAEENELNKLKAHVMGGEKKRMDGLRRLLGGK